MSNRRLFIIAAIAAVLLAAGWSRSQQSTIITANAFLLTNLQGETIGSFGADPQGNPYLYLARNGIQIALSVSEGGSIIISHDLTETIQFGS